MLSITFLFFSSFLAATIFPFYSEAVLLALLANGESPLLLIVVATIGNTLGAVFNWVLGRYCLHFQDRSWFPFKPQSLLRTQLWFRKYGVWSLLFAWLPIVGDAFTFIAGTMRVKLWMLVVLSGIGKAGRYIIIVLLADQVGASLVGY